MFKKRDQDLLAEAYQDIRNATSYGDPNLITPQEEKDNALSNQKRDESLVTFSNIENVIANNNASLAPFSSTSGHPSIPYFKHPSGLERHKTYLLVKGTKGKIPTDLFGNFKHGKTTKYVFFIPTDESKDKKMYISNLENIDKGWNSEIFSIEQVYTILKHI